MWDDSDDLSTLVSTPHDRLRREERNIKKVDLQDARRYGMSEPARFGRMRYTYAGRVFIYDPFRKRCITSWESRDPAAETSGSRVRDPVLLQKSVAHDYGHANLLHSSCCKLIRDQQQKWRSHTVLVIDMSGSMRSDDVNGARCRSDGVWMILARDFCRTRLETKTVSLYDLVSVILMHDQARVVIDCEPMDYVLYNKLVDLREWTEVKPFGPGNYMPALKKAEDLLSRNSMGSCSLGLMFFSDGKPSDQRPGVEELPKTMGAIASKFGRRLCISCIGMASEDESFSMLEAMVTEACAYDVRATFSKPALCTESLSGIITSSLTSSLQSSISELTHVGTGMSQSVRSDVAMERRDVPDDVALTDQWNAYSTTSDRKYVLRVFAWDTDRRDFVTVLDRRCIGCFTAVAEPDYQVHPEKGKLCLGCRACHFCHPCSSKTALMARHAKDECKRLMNERRQGFIVKREIASFGVAMRKQYFGEGAERMTFKLRFLDDYDEFVGPHMVAKESRFVNEHEAEHNQDDDDYLNSSRYEYHKQFMQTQAIASKFAHKYNDAVEKLLQDHQSQPQQDEITIPKIRFLDPLVFELEDGEHDSNKPRRHNILIEPQIPGKYTKYIGNFGEVKIEQIGTELHSSLDREDVAFLLGNTNMGASNAPLDSQQPNLNTIEEDEEDESSSDDDEHTVDIPETRHANKFDNVFDHTAISLPGTTKDLGNLSDQSFLQAFSHFSYARSGGGLMVVDLQGAMQVHGDGTREFVLTDPAIHQKRGKNGLEHMNLGRTNRGAKGIKAFFDSHECNDMCRLLGLRPRFRRS